MLRHRVGKASAKRRVRRNGNQTDRFGRRTKQLFGKSVGISGNTVVVGAFSYAVGANADQGAASVFVRKGITWIHQTRLIASDGGEDNRFGTSVALNGSTKIVGASFVNQTTGAAYLYGTSPTAAVTVAGRVLNGKRSVSRATVYLTDSNGATRTALPNGFGYYQFDEVAAGETYIFNASAKRFSFAPQVVTVTEDLTELNFTAHQKPVPNLLPEF